MTFLCSVAILSPGPLSLCLCCFSFDVTWCHSLRWVSILSCNRCEFTLITITLTIDYWTQSLRRIIHSWYRNQPSRRQILSLLGRYSQQLSKMVITRIVSMNFLFRHWTHMSEITLCANGQIGFESWAWASQALESKSLQKFNRECANRFMRVAWTKTDSMKTSGRNGEKMCSVTDRLYFRRHGCPCEDLWRWPHCHR